MKAAGSLSSDSSGLKMVRTRSAASQSQRHRVTKDKINAHAGMFSTSEWGGEIEATQDGFTLDGKPVRSLDLKSDADDHPTIVRLGSLSFQIIKRGDKFGLRVKDSQNPDRINFKGTEFYAPDLKWRIDAQFRTLQSAEANADHQCARHGEFREFARRGEVRG